MMERAQGLTTGGAYVPNTPNQNRSAQGSGSAYAPVVDQTNLSDCRDIHTGQFLRPDCQVESGGGLRFLSAVFGGRGRQARLGCDRIMRSTPGVVGSTVMSD